MLNKSKGNMYPFVTHTWNPIKGKCLHDCKYCYMKIFPQKELRLDQKDLRTDLGENNTIFVGSSTDMFADNVHKLWIYNVIERCYEKNNQYLFQTKNAVRLHEFEDCLPASSIIAVTLETNRDYNVSKALNYKRRVINIETIRFLKMISIEPVLDFDLDIFLKDIEKINPFLISIGADSKNHNLPEPSVDKLIEFIKELKKKHIVVEKLNLKRLINPKLEEKQ